MRHLSAIGWRQASHRQRRLIDREFDVTTATTVAQGRLRAAVSLGQGAPS